MKKCFIEDDKLAVMLLKQKWSSERAQRETNGERLEGEKHSDSENIMGKRKK